MAITRSDITDKVRRDLKKISDKAVTENQINSYVTDALDEGSSILLENDSKYFRTYKDYIVQQGDDHLVLPEDIADVRIEYISYDPGDDTGYKVRQIGIDEIDDVEPEDRYRFMIVNNIDDGLRLNIYPSIRESSINHFRVYYIRTPRILENDADICDFPRIQYIYAHVAMSCVLTERNNPNRESVLAKFQRQESNLMSFATRLTNDPDETKLEPSTEQLYDYDNFDL